MADFAEGKAGGTMEMPAIYVSYVETPRGEGVFAYLPGIEAAATAVEARRKQAASPAFKR
jgi:hypothetical protein